MLDLNNIQEAGDNEEGKARDNRLHTTTASMVTQIRVQEHQGATSCGALLIINKHKGGGHRLTLQSSQSL